MGPDKTGGDSTHNHHLPKPGTPKGFLVRSARIITSYRFPERLSLSLPDQQQQSAMSISAAYGHCRESVPKSWDFSRNYEPRSTLHINPIHGLPSTVSAVVLFYAMSKKKGAPALLQHADTHKIHGYISAQNRKTPKRLPKFKFGKRWTHLCCFPRAGKIVLG